MSTNASVIDAVWLLFTFPLAILKKNNSHGKTRLVSPALVLLLPSSLHEEQRYLPARRLHPGFQNVLLYPMFPCGPTRSFRVTCYEILPVAFVLVMCRGECVHPSFARPPESRLERERREVLLHVTYRDDTLVPCKLLHETRDRTLFSMAP